MLRVLSFPLWLLLPVDRNIARQGDVDKMRDASLVRDGKNLRGGRRDRSEEGPVSYRSIPFHIKLLVIDGDVGTEQVCHTVDVELENLRRALVQRDGEPSQR